MLVTENNSRLPQTVLVVDDEVMILRYVRTLLEADGYKVITADSGTEALAQLRSGLRPDAVLLDVNMPGMDGLETLRELLRLYPGSRVIMCSCEADPRKALNAFVLGAQDFLTKPFRHLYLSAALERCLNTNDGTRSAPWDMVRDLWEAAT